MATQNPLHCSVQSHRTDFCAVKQYSRTPAEKLNYINSFKIRMLIITGF